MTAIDVLVFAAGVAGHKAWRFAWAVRRGTPARTAVRREFAPADLQPPVAQPRRERPLSPTEVGV